MNIPVWGLYHARTGIARGTRGVLRIIQPNHKYVDVSSHMGPVAWCDHGNSTEVKFLRAFRSALRTRNRTGDKIVRGPWLDVTEALVETVFINHKMINIWWFKAYLAKYCLSQVLQQICIVGNMYLNNVKASAGGCAPESIIM